ncbi:MAG: phosphatase PAP2 family protein [Elusimicrobiota bacterium]|nr:phosphatase PAP2 family protein [Elusimicrobiota bacterium]
MPNSVYRRSIFILSLLALPLVQCFAGTAGIFSTTLPDRAALSSVLPPAPAPALAAAVSRPAASGHYLELSGLDLTAVPAAPLAGSREDKADFVTLFSWQSRRTGADCARAKSEMYHSYEVFFGKITPFTAPQAAEVTAFFKNAAEDSVAANTYLKNVYQRQRPFLRDAGIVPCIPKTAGLSYPSGHAAMARLFALILGDLAPSRKAEFMARADEAALNRVLAGVHHPTDVEAGKLLSGTLYKQLLGQPDFVADMRSLRRFLK